MSLLLRLEMMVTSLMYGRVTKFTDMCLIKVSTQKGWELRISATMTSHYVDGASLSGLDDTFTYGYG